MSDEEMADARLCVKPSTKQLVDERKKDGKTYDLWVRELMGVGVE